MSFDEMAEEIRQNLDDSNSYLSRFESGYGVDWQDMVDSITCLREALELLCKKVFEEGGCKCRKGEENDGRKNS